MSLGQPGCGGAKHFFESIAVIMTISPLMSSYLLPVSILAEAYVLMQVSRWSIKKTLKPFKLKQVLSPVLSEQKSQLSSGDGLTPISPSPSVKEIVIVSVYPLYT